MERHGRRGITTFDKRPIVDRLFFVVSYCCRFVPRCFRPPNAFDSRLPRSFVAASSRPPLLLFRKFFAGWSMISLLDLYRFYISDKRFREASMVRGRISMGSVDPRVGGERYIASRLPCCTFLCTKLMPKRADAHGSLRIIRIGGSARTMGHDRMNRVSTLGLRVDFPMMRS